MRSAAVVVVVVVVVVVGFIDLATAFFSKRLPLPCLLACSGEARVPEVSPMLGLGFARLRGCLPLLPTATPYFLLLQEGGPP